MRKFDHGGNSVVFFHYGQFFLGVLQYMKNVTKEMLLWKL